jgi:hypothetical protein
VHPLILLGMKTALCYNFENIYFILLITKMILAESEGQVGGQVEGGGHSPCLREG